MSRIAANDIIVAVGTPLVVGTLIQTEQADLMTASGTSGTGITGLVDSTTVGDISSSQGSPVSNGYVASTTTGDIAIMLGSPIVYGTINKTTNGDSMTANGSSGEVIVTTMVNGKLTVVVRNSL